MNNNCLFINKLLWQHVIRCTFLVLKFSTMLPTRPPERSCKMNTWLVKLLYGEKLLYKLYFWTFLVLFWLLSLLFLVLQMITNAHTTLKYPHSELAFCNIIVLNIAKLRIMLSTSHSCKCVCTSCTGNNLENWAVTLVIQMIWLSIFIITFWVLIGEKEERMYT